MTTDLVAGVWPSAVPVPYPIVAPGEEAGVLRCFKRLRTEVGTPYYLSLVAATLIFLRTIQPNSVYRHIGALARLWKCSFATWPFASLDEWIPQIHLAAALAGEIPGITPASGDKMRYTLVALHRDFAQWIACLPEASRVSAAALLPPGIHDVARLRRHFARRHRHPRREERERRLDALMAGYGGLAELVDARWAFLERLEALGRTTGQARITDGAGAHDFRFWRVLQPGGEVDTICEYLGSDPAGQPLWFAEMMEQGALGGGRSPASWLKSEGLPTTYFNCGAAGLLQAPRTVGPATRQLGQGRWFALSAVVAAARFGHAAFHTMISSAARTAELAQLAQLQHRRGAIVFEAIAKGSRPATFELSPAAAAAARGLAAFLKAHYRLGENGEIPTVAFYDAKLARPAKPYLFQWRSRHLTGQAISACYRFLLFGLLRDEDGRHLPLNTHLFRHGCAKWKHNIEGLPLAMVARALNHSPSAIAVTCHYAQPAASQAVEATRQALRRMADDL